MISSPFELCSIKKNELILAQLNKLTCHHAKNCVTYKRYLDAYGVSAGEANSIVELPYLPARAFKELDLKSVVDKNITKTLTSSGTSGLQSRIHIDGRTSIKQSRALSEILKSYIGMKKLPLLIIDSPSMGKRSSVFSARSAGTLGFSGLASDKFFALDEEFNLNLSEIERFLTLYGDSEFMLFGFTFLIWQSFVINKSPDFLVESMKNGRLFHGGGWKKLSTLGISDSTFRNELCSRFGLRNIHNYYGMAEQTGSVFIECKYGRMHASKYSEVLIRSLHGFDVLPEGEKGIIHVLSSLPESYPGHSILTEDLGWVEHDVLCPCGRNGTTIHVDGRIERAEVRGCSDVY